MTVIQVKETTNPNELQEDLERHVTAIEAALDGGKPAKFAMAVAGRSLPVIYETPELSSAIKKLFAGCEAVIVYRSSPAQKAETVKYIRKNLST